MARRNLTVQLDERVIRKVKVAAARRGTSISGLIAHELESIAECDERYEDARARVLEALQAARPRGGRRWTREELHDR